MISAWANRPRLVDDYGVTGWGMLVYGLGGLLVLFAVLAVTITLTARAYGRASCSNWADATGYSTKFVVVNWADTGTCLALAPNGRWVKSSQVTLFESGKR